MAPNSLYPAFGVLEYTSAYGNHKQTIPTRDWNAGIGTNGYGGYVGWDESTPNDAEDMWTDLVTALKAFHLATTTFNVVTIYTMASAVAVPRPRMIIPLSIVGTNGSSTWAKAVMQTWNMRSVDFGKFKLVALDTPTGGSFGKVLAAAFDAPDDAIVGELTDETKAWSARDSSRISAAISKTLTLNDKLRRSYGDT